MRVIIKGRSPRSESTATDHLSFGSMSTGSLSHSEETLKRVASYLRTGRALKTQELIMAEKRVEVFKGT